MTSSNTHVIVNVTVPDDATARSLTTVLLENRLAACVHVLPVGRSCYRWEGKVEVEEEHLLLIKSTTTQLDRLEKAVLEAHPYEAPEIIVTPVVFGNQRYLEWVEANVN